MNQMINNALAIKLPVGQKFVEPKLFDSPDRILAEFAREIHPRAVQRHTNTENELSIGGMQNQIKVLLSTAVHGGSFSDTHYNFSQDSTSSSDLNYSNKLGDQGGNFIYAAAKTLKSQYTPDMWRKFAIEAATLAQFNHPNVVMLHGVVTHSEDSPKMLILEYCERGSLDALLPLLAQMDLTNCNTLQSGEQLSMGGDEHEMLNKQVNNPASIGGGAGSAGVFASSQQITHILRGVACGMHYLADEGYIHKVLRARNIFVSGSFLPKIAGFDERTLLEEDMDLFFLNSNTGYDSQKLPLVFEDIAAWTAPEALVPPYNFSLFSDIWSFGCLIFECFSEGERPFGNNKASEISKIVSSNTWRGLPRPQNCPEPLLDLMTLCCSKDQHQKRPWFSQIRAFLDNLVRSPCMQQQQPLGKNQMNYQPLNKPFNKQSSDQHCFQLASPHKTQPSGLHPGRQFLFDSQVSIEEILGGIKMEKYCENFKVHGYYSLAEVISAIDTLAQTSVRQHPKQSRMLELASKKFFKQIGIASKKDRSILYKKVQSLFMQPANYLQLDHTNSGVTVMNNYHDNLGRQYLDGTL